MKKWEDRGIMMACNPFRHDDLYRVGELQGWLGGGKQAEIRRARLGSAERLGRGPLSVIVKT